MYFLKLTYRLHGTGTEGKRTMGDDRTQHAASVAAGTSHSISSSSMGVITEPTSTEPRNYTIFVTADM
jgi:hypothetical protein